MLCFLQYSSTDVRLIVVSVRMPCRKATPLGMRLGWNNNSAKGIRPNGDTSLIPVKRMSKLLNGTFTKGSKSVVRVPRKSRWRSGRLASTDKSDIRVRHRLSQSSRILPNGEKSLIP